MVSISSTGCGVLHIALLRQCQAETGNAENLHCFQRNVRTFVFELSVVRLHYKNTRL